jgi:hypothetical protein
MSSGKNLLEGCEPLNVVELNIALIVLGAILALLGLINGISNFIRGPINRTTRVVKGKAPITRSHLAYREDCNRGFVTEVA